MVDTSKNLPRRTPTQDFNFRLGKLEILPRRQHKTIRKTRDRRAYFLSKCGIATQAFSDRSSNVLCWLRRRETTNPQYAYTTGNGIQSFNKIMVLAIVFAFKGVLKATKLQNQGYKKIPNELERTLYYCCLDTTQNEPKFFTIHVINI